MFIIIKSLFLIEMYVKISRYENLYLFGNRTILSVTVSSHITVVSKVQTAW